MNHEDSYLPLGLAGTAALLTRARPTLTVDELDRLDRRLHPPRARRRRSNLVVAFCAALGLMFTTAGTGLAISGFVTPAPAVRAQYPDAAARAGTPPRGGQGSAGRSHARPHSSGRRVRPPSLADTARARRSEDIRNGLNAAEARPNAPFTGLAAIPILMAGIAFTVTGAFVHRRPPSDG
jgi:hypothetical protein